MEDIMFVFCNEALLSLLAPPCADAETMAQASEAMAARGWRGG